MYTYSCLLTLLYTALWSSVRIAAVATMLLLSRVIKLCCSIAVDVGQQHLPYCIACLFSAPDHVCIRCYSRNCVYCYYYYHQAFDSPNFPPLATLGVTINFNYRRDLVLPPPRLAFRVHTSMDRCVLSSCNISCDMYKAVCCGMHTAASEHLGVSCDI
jgi:hypothetical protein